MADALGHLAAVLRAYGQLGQQVNEAEAAGLLAQARGDFDAILQRLLRRGTKQLPQAEAERLSQRWRSVRDATYTRPSPEIGALMSDIGEDIAAQLRALLPAPPAAGAGGVPVRAGVAAPEPAVAGEGRRLRLLARRPRPVGADGTAQVRFQPLAGAQEKQLSR